MAIDTLLHSTTNASQKYADDFLNSFSTEQWQNFALASA